jgi:hypothetical protein|tara:strand:+ start:207 stop:656 length:450 start_codon:yes stop_codon:yes gene_type:complete
MDWVIIVFSGLALIVSFWASYQTWSNNKTSQEQHKVTEEINQKQFEKIKEDSLKAQHLALNPSWFAGRMGKDHWWFGLLTVNNQIIAIKTINSISDDGEWLEVILLTDDEVPENLKKSDLKFVCAVADDRRTASVRVASVAMAFELVSS